MLVQIKNGLKKSKALENCHRRIRSWSTAILITASPFLFVKLRYKSIRGNWPNLTNPHSFDEKLLWLNLYWRHPLKTHCGDKYTIRSYVKELGLERLLPHLLGVYEQTNEIDFDALPESFALKCTHGCGFNIICKSKSVLNRDEAKWKLDKWLKVDFSRVYGELHYAAMKPRIICEQFLLDDLSSNLPIDYKIFCFGGRVHCTMACLERSLMGGAEYYFYDRNWENILPYNSTRLLISRNILPKPAAYEEMIAAAEVLSKPFPFVRMDFYSIEGKAVLGEMTFTPAGCIDVDIIESGQRILGELILLPHKLL